MNNIFKITLAIFLIYELTSCYGKKKIKSFDSDGNLEVLWIFEKDTLTGTKFTYWPNGKLKVVYTYRDGNLDGEYLGYYENGFIARKSYFVKNNLRGLAYRFYPDVEGIVARKTYYLDVEGKQYVYYDSTFDKFGKALEHEQTVSIDFDCQGHLPIATINFVGAFAFDSVYLITGNFSANFSLNTGVTLDTVRALKTPIQVQVNSDAFRGKCIFYEGTKIGDSTRIDVRTRYFEETEFGCGK